VTPQLAVLFLSANTTTPAPTPASPLSSLLLPLITVVLLYFLIIRPQRNRTKAQQSLTASLEVGDRVQTIGGIRGVIRALDDDSVVLEVEQGKIRLARRAVASKIDSAG
jgi:preprotein translocase subunit YajC